MKKHKLTVRQREVLEVLARTKHCWLVPGYHSRGWRIRIEKRNQLHANTAESLCEKDYVDYDTVEDAFVISGKGLEALDEQT